MASPTGHSNFCQRVALLSNSAMTQDPVWGSEIISSRQGQGAVSVWVSHTAPVLPSAVVSFSIARAQGRTLRMWPGGLDTRSSIPTTFPWRPPCPHPSSTCLCLVLSADLAWGTLLKPADPCCFRVGKALPLGTLPFRGAPTPAPRPQTPSLPVLCVPVALQQVDTLSAPLSLGLECIAGNSSGLGLSWASCMLCWAGLTRAPLTSYPGSRNGVESVIPQPGRCLGSEWDSGCNDCPEAQVRSWVGVTPLGGECFLTCTHVSVLRDSMPGDCAAGSMCAPTAVAWASQGWKSLQWGPGVAGCRVHVRR